MSGGISFLGKRYALLSNKAGRFKNKLRDSLLDLLAEEVLGIPGKGRFIIYKRDNDETRHTKKVQAGYIDDDGPKGNMK